MKNATKTQCERCAKLSYASLENDYDSLEKSNKVLQDKIDNLQKANQNLFTQGEDIAKLYHELIDAIGYERLLARQVSNKDLSHEKAESLRLKLEDARSKFDLLLKKRFA